MTKKEMLGQMEELRSTCVDICTNLWNNPETGGNEQKSADMIRELLHHEGFVIVNEEHLPHAFYAEYGSVHKSGKCSLVKGTPAYQMESDLSLS